MAHPWTPRPPARLTRPDARALVALLAVTLGLAGVLAVEAEREVRSHHVASARVLREHLAAAGRDALDAVERTLGGALAGALGPAVAARAASPYEVLPPPALLAERAGGAGPLACPDAPPAWVRLDLRDGSLAAAGAPLAPAVARWVTDTAQAVMRAAPPGPVAGGGDVAYAVVLGAGAQRGRALALGVRRAPYDAPIALYGLVTCADAFGPRLVAAARRAPGGATLDVALGDSLLAVRVGAAAGERAVAERRAAGLAIAAVEHPGAARRVVLPGARRAPLALLAALMGLTGALAAAAVRQLRRAQELVDLRADFTSSVSHELRTPLAQIRLYGETLALGRVRTDAQRRHAAEAIVREARRLEGMVANVLHLARAERRLTVARAERVALAPLAREVARDFAPLAPRARLAVAVPEGLAAAADPDALRQILLNLLDNAARYGPPGQTVRVGAAPGAASGAGLVDCWVEDEGPGIPARDRARVWEPFVRLARPAAGTGSGLGLAVVADLARAQGGGVWIADAPGADRPRLRVGVTLPAAAGGGAAGDGGGADAAAGGRP